MNQALRAPARVASITLLDPAGLTKLAAVFTTAAAFFTYPYAW